MTHTYFNIIRRFACLAAFPFVAGVGGGLPAHASWDELALLVRGLSDGSLVLEKTSRIQPSIYTAAVFLDFDNDGHLDLLMMGQGGDWNFSGKDKYLHLYRNLGPEHDFELRRVNDTGLPQRRDEAYFNPISVGDVDHDGYTDLVIMSHDGTRHVDVYRNEQGTGRFTLLQSLEHPATNGAVTLGDLNGDGWLDIFYTGYSDYSAREARVWRCEPSAQTFTDVTPASLKGAWQGQSTLGDLDGDGRLDLLSTGTGDNWACLASLYLNRTAQDEAPSFEYVSETSSGLRGASRGNALIADFNADGHMDVIIGGETESNVPQNGFRTRIYYQREDGTFALDTRYPVLPVNQDGGINMGDADGDGNMDLVLGGWVGSHDDNTQYYATPLRVYYNRGTNTLPIAPAEVIAYTDEAEEHITIEWTPGSDSESPLSALRYNIFVRNDDTGETWMLIPADLETGRLRVGTDLQTSLSSAVASYTMRTLGKGHYTVGVSTLDQSYAPSPFTTANIDIVTAVEAPLVPSASVQPAAEWRTLTGQRIERPTLPGVYLNGSQKLFVR